MTASTLKPRSSIPAPFPVQRHVLRFWTGLKPVWERSGLPLHNGLKTSPLPGSISSKRNQPFIIPRCTHCRRVVRENYLMATNMMMTTPLWQESQVAFGKLQFTIIPKEAAPSPYGLCQKSYRGQRWIKVATRLSLWLNFQNMV